MRIVRKSAATRTSFGIGMNEANTIYASAVTTRWFREFI